MWRSFPVQTALSLPAIRSAAWRIFPMTDTDAFSIMTFHTDIGVRELFLDVYTRFLPQMTPGFSVLEISYSIGIGLGVVLYFNHFGRRKFTQDPTPLEVEMRVYEDDIDTTIIEQNDRSGKGKEAFHANPARDPADHSRS